MKKTKYGLSILTVFLCFMLSLGNCKSTQKSGEGTDATETEETNNTDTNSGNDSDANTNTDTPDDSSTRNLDPSETEKGSLPDGSEEEPAEKQESDELAKLERGSEAETQLVNELNRQMKSWRYPDGNRINGFAYKGVRLPGRDLYRSWIIGKKPLISRGIKKLRDGYKLEITGHADASGPDEPQPELNKKGNIYYSKERARSMKAALVREGFPAERIIIRGAGSQELLPDVDSRSPKNRRVTFQLIAED